MRIIFFGLILLSLLPNADAQLNTIVENLNRAVGEVNKEVGQALNKQEQAVAAKATEVRNWPANDATSNIQSDLQRTSSAIDKAKAVDKGNIPKSRRDIVITAETIRTVTRPVFTLCNSGAWATPEAYSRWSTYIDPFREKLSRAASSVGMFVWYTSEGRWIQNGATGFLVNGNYVVTNRHVLELYATKDITSDSWTLIKGRELRIQFPYEYQRCHPRQATRELKISGVAAVGSGEEGDFALLTVEMPVGLALPSIELAKKFELSGGARVVAIGYPGRPDSCGPSDPTSEFPCTYLTETQIDHLFQSPDSAVPFPAERISPGLILVNTTLPDGIFSYDSSTWGGSSGSPIVSLVDGTVIGIQSQGITAMEDGVSYNNGISVDQIIATLERLKAGQNNKFNDNSTH